MNTLKIKKKIKRAGRKCQINYLGDNKYLDKKQVEKAACHVISSYWKLSGLPPKTFMLDINVISDKKIKSINKMYLNRDIVTDVIAFSLQEGVNVPEKESPLIGQVVISRDAAKRQSVFYKHGVKDEIFILLIHGLLHVAGWKEGKEIQKCQKLIKSRLEAQI